MYYTAAFLHFTPIRMREGLKWKAHSHEVRVARTWNVKPDPQGHAQKTKTTQAKFIKHLVIGALLLTHSTALKQPHYFFARVWQIVNQ